MNFVGQARVQAGPVGPMLRCRGRHVVAGELVHIHRLRIEKHRLRFVCPRV